MKDIAMRIITQDRIMPHSGVAFEIRSGQLLKVSAPEGEQVSDLICYNLGDIDEWLCSGRTIDHSRSWRLGEGDVLYSNRSSPMFSILEDSCGKHDFLLAPCSQNTFQVHDEVEELHTSCHENLYCSLMGWDIDPDEIYTTFSMFMNVSLQEDGNFKIGVPASKAGDHVLFRAEMDMVVGLTSCSCLQYNNGSLKPIDYKILQG